MTNCISSHFRPVHMRNRWRRSATPLFTILLLTAQYNPVGLRAEEPEPPLSHLHWLGQSTFRIELGGESIYTDPYRIGKAKPAGIILITHNHYDHCSPEDVKKIRTAETIIIAPADCARKLGGTIHSLRPDQQQTIRGLKIRAVRAYNTRRKYHPRRNGWVGYILEIAGTRIYLAGDTDFIPEMKNLGHIDIALLPVSGTYVMTAREAVRAALAIKPTIAVPMHYGSIVGSRKDAEAFATGLRGRIRVVILNRE